MVENTRICRVVKTLTTGKNFIEFYNMKIQKQFGLFPVITYR